MSTNYDALFLKENLDQIDAVFKKGKEKAEETATAEKRKLSNSIFYYQSSSPEDIKNDIKIRAFNKFGNIRDHIALKRAIEKEYEERKQCVVPESVIEEIIQETSTKTKIDLIRKYRGDLITDYIKREEAKAEKDMMVFGLMTNEQKEQYIKLFKNMVLASELYDKRKEAILAVAKSLKIEEIPMCMEYPSPVDNRIRKIAKIDLQDKDDISFKDKVRMGLNKSDDNIYNNKKYVWLSIAFTFFASTCVGFSSIHAGVSEPAAIAASFATLALTASTLGAFFHSSDIQDYLDDKRIVDEARKLGLYDCSKKWIEATEAFIKYDESLIKDNSTMEIDGGKHELH